MNFTFYRDHCSPFHDKLLRYNMMISPSTVGETKRGKFIRLLSMAEPEVFLCLTKQASGNTIHNLAKLKKKQ